MAQLASSVPERPSRRARQRIGSLGAPVAVGGEDRTFDPYVSSTVHVEITDETPNTEQGEPRGSLFDYVIQLKTHEPQEQESIVRFLQLATALPASRREALVDMPFNDVLGLLSAALPTTASADELVGPFYDTKGLAERWHISEQAVHKRADKAHKLLKVLTMDDVALYPAFQFDNHGGMLPGLPEVIAAFEPITDRWTIARWLKAPSRRLAEQSPADLLRRGETNRVTALASGFGDRLSA